MRFDVHPTAMKQKQGAPLNRMHLLLFSKGNIHWIPKSLPWIIVVDNPGSWTVRSDQSSEMPDCFRTELRFSWRNLFLIFSVYQNRCKFGWPHHAPSAEHRVLGHKATEQPTEQAQAGSVSDGFCIRNAAFSVQKPEKQQFVPLNCPKSLQECRFLW